MTRTIESPQKDQIEQLIDTYGLQQMVAVLGELADEKAQHINDSWQDRALAKTWERAGGRLAVSGLRCVRKLRHDRVPARRERNKHDHDNRSRPHSRGGFDLG